MERTITRSAGTTPRQYRLLTRTGQALPAMVELIEQSRLGMDELIDVLYRASVETVLWLMDCQPTTSSEERRSRGLARKPDRHGELDERKLRLRRRQLRKKYSGREGKFRFPLTRLKGSTIRTLLPGGNPAQQNLQQVGLRKGRRGNRKPGSCTGLLERLVECGLGQAYKT